MKDISTLTNGLSAVQFVKYCHNLICCWAKARYESAFVIYCDRKKFPIMGRNMVELISWRLVGNAFPALVRYEVIAPWAGGARAGRM